MTRRKSTSEVVPWIPIIRSDFIPIPGLVGPRPRLSLVLRVLAGNDCDLVRHHLNSTRPGDIPQEYEAQFSRLRADPANIAKMENCMIAMMRRLADLWIDSGKSGPERNYDNPAERNILYSPPEGTLNQLDDSQFTPQATIKDIFYGLLLNETQWPQIHLDGTQSLKEVFFGFKVDRTPVFSFVDELKRFAMKIAMYWFGRLLDSPHSRYLTRCDECRRYFAYTRERRTTSKRGVYCSRCKRHGHVDRVEATRKEAKEKMLSVAAAAWNEWQPSHRSPDQRVFVARRVYAACGTHIQRKWVSQNLKEIQERAEALQNAKS